MLYNSLAFVAGLKRATDEGSLPEIAYIYIYIYIFFFFFFFFFFFLDSVKIISAHMTGQSVGGAKTGEPREKPPRHPQAELGLSHMWPERGSNPHQTQRYDDRVIKKQRS